MRGVKMLELGKALKVNTTLTELSLHGNGIRMTLCCLSRAKHLTRIQTDTADNEEACSISEALKTNTTLTKLDLGGLQHLSHAIEARDNDCEDQQRITLEMKEPRH